MTSKTGSHIAIGTLFEAVRLNAELDAAAQSHLQKCDVCQGRQHWMATAASLRPTELALDPPDDVMDKVLALGRPSGLSRLRRLIVATLSFDSFGALAPAGVRRAETAERHMTFDAKRREPAEAPDGHKAEEDQARADG